MSSLRRRQQTPIAQHQFIDRTGESSHWRTSQLARERIGQSACRRTDAPANWRTSESVCRRVGVSAHRTPIARSLVRAHHAHLRDKRFSGFGHSATSALPVLLDIQQRSSARDDAAAAPARPSYGFAQKQTGFTGSLVTGSLRQLAVPLTPTGSSPNSSDSTTKRGESAMDTMRSRQRRTGRGRGVMGLARSEQSFGC